MKNKVIDLALSCVGYLEKKSNAELDDFTANAGSGNFTKFARDLDAIPNFYNGKKNGYPWCDVFVDWLFVQVFGVEQAKKMLCQPEKSLGAGCGYSARYYQAKGRFFPSPVPGDQIFFRDNQGNICHTGLVVAVEGSRIHTVEGNTDGGVFQKSYSIYSGSIYGYGRPEYKNQETKEEKGSFTVKMLVLKQGMMGSKQVRALQLLLIGNGCTCGSWGADGNFGEATQTAVRNYQKKNGLQVDGMAGPETMSHLLGAA